MPPVSQSKLLSSRAQRDVQSDKDQDEIEQKSEAPSFTQDLLGVSFTSQGEVRSALKNIQGGLVSIEEKQEEQPDYPVAAARTSGPVRFSNQS